MKYYVTVNKKYRYVRVFDILKRPHESTNKVSKWFSAFIDKMVAKQQKKEV